MTSFLSGLLVVIGIATAWWVYLGRREESREIAERYGREADCSLADGPSATALTRQLLPLVPTSVRDYGPLTSRSGEHLAVLEMVRAWHDLVRRSATDLEAARQLEAATDVAEASVRSINSMAELVDLGLVHPQRFLRERIGRHRELLDLTALLEPYIWYQALVAGRGRWGFRPLQIGRIARRLAAISNDLQLAETLSIATERDGVEFGAVVLEPVGRRSRLRNSVRGWLRPATINRRSKIRQRDDMERFRQLFLENGITTAKGLVQW
jgi:hypothetical protein